jgi:VWFA-related protein
MNLMERDALMIKKVLLLYFARLGMRLSLCAVSAFSAPLRFMRKCFHRRDAEGARAYAEIFSIAKVSSKTASSIVLSVMFLGSVEIAHAQSFQKDFDAKGKVEIVIVNRNGRVVLVSSDEQEKVFVSAESKGTVVTEKDLNIAASGGRVEITVTERKEKDRIDLTVKTPKRAKVKITSDGGAISVVGNIAEAEIQTNTGTIHADVPLDSVKLNFKWQASRPRFMSDVELPKIKEQDAGVFEIKGTLGDKKAKDDVRVRLNFITERGLMLLNVDPLMVPNDLRERPLTEAAKAIVKSGDKELVEAIRKVVPKVYGDYAKTLPPRKESVSLTRPTENRNLATQVAPQTMRVNAVVTDRNGRAISGLTAQEFSLIENGKERTISDVAPTSTPFNLILLLDVSGSVEERMDFIRKAARNFLNTASKQDKISIISFRDDIQIISDFTTDREKLSDSLDLIDAGGGTSLYDAIAYSLVHSLKSLRGDRTAIVILSDGDDNRSFIPFEALMDSILESGALIYPLYVPSGLIRESSLPNPMTTLDPTRTRFMTLTSRAEQEGDRLAKVSGGVYYPIRRIEDLQKAYDDVVAQLRMAYTITYVSDLDADKARRIRVSTKREGIGVRLSPAIGINTP